MAKALTDEEIELWGQEIGSQYSIDSILEDLQVYKGVRLTPENSEEMEVKYLQDLELRRQSLKLDEFHGMREVMQKELYFLTKYALEYKDLQFYIHYPMCLFMENLSHLARGMVQMPRSTFKTTICTIGDSCRWMLIDPNIRILMASHEMGHAENNVVETRDRFLHSEMVKEFYPEHIPTTVKGFEGKQQWTTPGRTEYWKEGTLNAAGGKTLKTGTHYNRVIGDDIWDANSVRSSKMLEMVQGNMNLLKFLLIGQEEAGAIIYVCTRWAHNDPSESLIEDPQYQVLRASALTKEGKSIFPVNPKNKKAGYSVRKLWDIAQDEYEFFCQMMNNPQNTTQGFKDEWFQWLSWEEIYWQKQRGELNYRTVVYVDLAGTESNRSDYNALVVMAFLNDGRKIVVGAAREKATPYEFAKKMFLALDQFKSDYPVLQKASVESFMLPYLKDMNTARKAEKMRVYNFQEYSLGSSSKEARIGTLAAPFEAGEIYFNEDTDIWAAGIPDLINELLAYPHTSGNDDLSDAMSMINEKKFAAKPMGPSYEPKPLEMPKTKEEWDEIYKELRQEMARKSFEEAEGEDLRAEDPLVQIFASDYD